MKKGLLLSLIFAALCFVTGSVWAQTTVTGRVTSAEDGQGLPGVNVVIKGTTQGTVTDVDGNYSLSAPSDPGIIIQYSFVGFTTQELPATGGAINVVLAPESKLVNEAVVVGYGTVNRRDLTGSIASVSSKDFQKGVVTTADQLISGKMAGVQITPSSGAPGAGSQIRIRGVGSLNSSNDPLFVIDGVPIDNGTIAGLANPLAMINPNDIENITVLKDPSSAAIYGSRASNGVILITTKKGAIGGRPTFSFYSQNSISFIRKQISVLDTAQFKKIVRDSGTAAQIKLLGNSKTDWQKEIYQPAVASDNQFAVSGGFKIGSFALPYRASVGYLHQTGILKTDLLDRATASVTLNPSFLNGHLKLNVNAKSSYAEQRFANQGAIGSAAGFDPTHPVHADTSLTKGRELTADPRYGGYFEWLDNSDLPNTLAPRNPVGLLNQKDDRSTVNRSIGNVQLDYAIHGFEDLRINVNVGGDVSEGKGDVYITDSAASDYRTKGTHSRYKQRSENTLLETYLAYNKVISSIKSRFDVVAGYSFQKWRVVKPNYRTLSYRNDTVKTIAAPLRPDDVQEWALQSFYGRLNYAFKERYLLTATIRSDASSRFGPDYRVGIFPSGAFAWRIKDDLDDIFGEVKFISDLKARIGYGQTGQQDFGSTGNAGNYAYQGLYTLGGNTALYPLNGTYYNLSRPKPYDPALKWETNTTKNVGLDFAFLNSRIAGSVDLYNKETSDLLNTTPTPAGSNFSDILFTNVGRMQNRGIEFTLNTVPVQTQNLRWDVGFNVTYNENKITRLTSAVDTSSVGQLTGGISGGVGSTIQIQSVGSPINSFYVYKQRYDANGRPVEDADPLKMFVDLNGDGILNEKDRYRYHQALPKVYMGFNTAFSYKNFSLSATLRGSFGNYVYNNVYSERGVYSFVTQQPTYLSNPSTNILESGFTGQFNNTLRIQSDYYVQKADFVRLDNLILSYNLGPIISPRVGLAITGGAQNLFVITKYKGVDPEISSGIDNAFYARPRTFTLGLNFQIH